MVTSSARSTCCVVPSPTTAAASRPLREPDETEAAIIEEHWDPLIESIIEESEDETLLDRHLSGEPIDLDIVLPDLRAAIALDGSSPSFPRTPRLEMGIEGLFELFEQGFPSPASSPMPAVYTPAGQPFGPVT